MPAHAGATTTVPPDPVPSAAVTHPNGALVRSATSVYVFAGGRAFLVPRPELAKLLAVDHAVVLPVVAGYPPSTSQPPAPGTLLTTQHVNGKPTVYVVDANGELYGFASPHQLQAGGFDAALVVTVPSLGGLEVAPQSAGAAHLSAWSTRSNGAIVASSGEVFDLVGGRAVRVTGAALAGVRHEDQAETVGGDVTATDQSTAIADGTLVSAEGYPYAGVYVAFGGAMYAFSSLGQLQAEGYGGTAAVPAPASNW